MPRPSPRSRHATAAPASDRELAPCHSQTEPVADPRRDTYVRAVTPSVRLTPTSAEQFAAYRVAAEQSYAENISDSGMMPVAEGP